MGAKIFPTGLHEDQNDIKKLVDELTQKVDELTQKVDELTQKPINPMGSGLIYKKLNEQSSRKWLMYSILILGILLAGAAVVEFLLYTKILVID